MGKNKTIKIYKSIYQERIILCWHFTK